MKRLTLICLIFAAASAFGWNCPSGQIRQQAPAGTPTTTPYYDVVEGIAFICVPDPKVTPPSNPSSSSTSSSTSGASATSGSSSNSTSGASATGGNSSSSAQGGKGGRATATGGAGGSVSGSGNSSVGPVSSSSGVSNAGNSSNSNTNTSQGGTAAVSGSGNSRQGQGQSQSAAASNNGNGSNNYSSDTNVEAPKIPVMTAYAPSQFPTVMCFKGYGAGVQTMPVGVSLGGGKIDENCAILEAAGRARNLLAFCKVYISNKYVKKAGVTLEDCLTSPPVAAAVIAPPAPPVQPTIVILPPAAPIAAAVPVAPPVPQRSLLATCGLSYNRVDNNCKQVLDDALLYFKTNAAGHLVIVADPLTGRIKADGVRKYIVSLGVDPQRVRVEPFGSGSNIDVYGTEN